MRRFFYYNSASVSALPLLLDLYPAIAAYSLRKLRASYTGACIRIRRTSDNAEQDIGFVSDVIDIASAVSFVLAGGAGSGLVVKIYNQGTGGVTYDATQSLGTSQFFACNTSSFQMLNTKPALLTNHPDGGGSTSKPPLNLANRINGVKSFFGVNKINALVTANYLNGIEPGSQSGGLANGIFQGGLSAGVNGAGGFDGVNARSITGEDLNQQLVYVNLRSGNLYASKNGAVETNAGTFASSLEVLQLSGRSASSVTYLNGLFQEQIFYTTDESANKSAIETNINAYYGIY
jgi:hypothetical protein